jgi:Kdo2-lipid IVA lauroyltransferase/acyltransferase
VSRSPGLVQRAEYGLFRAAIGGGLLLGPGVGSAIAARAGRTGYTLGIRRTVVVSNLRHAFPDRDEAWIHRTASDSYAHLAREALLTWHYSKAGIDALNENAVIEGIDAFGDAMAAGNGAILLAGHLGNWELGSALVASRFPFDAVVRRQRNPLFDRAINGSRESFGMRIIDRTNSTRAILSSLRENRVVALIADQDARDSGFFVPFFNRLASSPRGPGVLALRTGAPLVLMVPLLRPDGKLHVRYRRLEFETAGDPDTAARDITALFAAGLEAGVREAPAQYLWHHRRWKTKPPEEPVR